MRTQNQLPSMNHWSKYPIKNLKGNGFRNTNEFTLERRVRVNSRRGRASEAVSGRVRFQTFARKCLIRNCVWCSCASKYNIEKSGLG